MSEDTQTAGVPGSASEVTDPTSDPTPSKLIPPSPEIAPGTPAAPSPTEDALSPTLTPEEMGRLSGPSHEMTDTVSSAVISIADRHYRDGRVSVTEMQTFLGGSPFQDLAGWLLKMRTSDAGVRDCNFHKYDLDGNGALTADEMLLAVQEYLTETQEINPELVQRVCDAAVQHFRVRRNPQVTTAAKLSPSNSFSDTQPQSPVRMIDKFNYHTTHARMAQLAFSLGKKCGGINQRWHDRFQSTIRDSEQMAEECHDEQVELSKPHQFCVGITTRLEELESLAQANDWDQLSELLPSLIRHVYKNKNAKGNNFTFTAPGKSTIKMSFNTSDGQNQPCLNCAALFDYALPAFKRRHEEYRMKCLEKRAMEIEEARLNTVKQKQAQYVAKKVEEQKVLLMKQEQKKRAQQEKKAEKRIQKAMQLAAAEEQARQDIAAREVRQEKQKQRESMRHRLFQQFLREKTAGPMTSGIKPDEQTPAPSEVGTLPLDPNCGADFIDGMSSAEHMAWIASLRNRALSPPLLVPQLRSPKQAKLQGLEDTSSPVMVPRVQIEYGSTGFPTGRHVQLRPLTAPAVVACEKEVLQETPQDSPEPTPEMCPASPVQNSHSPLFLDRMASSCEDEDDEAPTGALANLHAEIKLRKKRALLKAKERPDILKSGPVRDRNGMTMTFEEVMVQIDKNKKAFASMKSAYALTMSVRLQADHTGIAEHQDLKERVDVRGLMKLCGLPADHIRKMCDIFDREVPKSRAKVKGGLAPQNMSRVQFHRFMQKNGYQDKAIVSRLFEVFDSKRDNELSFEELLCGLAFFEDRPGGSEKFLPGNMSKQEAEDAESDDTFLDVCSRFFDLDGKQLISKLNIFKVLCLLTKREQGKHIADAIFDLLTLEKTLLTYVEFIEGACSQPELCTVFYKMMLLQGKQKGSKAFNTGLKSLIELTKPWADAQASGRMVGLDRIVTEFQEADYKQECHLARYVRRIAKLRRDTADNESAEYYATVMEQIVDKGWGFVEHERARLEVGLQAAGEQTTEDNMDSQLNKQRLLRKWKTILETFAPLYVKPLQPGQTMGT